MARIAFLAFLFTSPAFATPPAQRATDPRVRLGLVPAEVLAGSRLFFEETFGGNGRTCGTCHVSESNLTIERADMVNLPMTAPFLGAGVPGLEQPFAILRLLVQENVDGFGNPPMFRSIPHTLSLSTSIHATVDTPPGTDTVGWGGDGAPAPGTLREFAKGAVVQHLTKNVLRRPGIDFRLPTPEEEEALLAFQLSLGRTEDIELVQVRLFDPQAERGRVLFDDPVNNNCDRCHNDAGANRTEADGSGNQNKDTNVDALRMQFAPHDDGRGTPGDETFSPPPLIEAADTAPFFHVGTIGDLESAVRFYTTAVGLFSGQQQTFGEDSVQDLGAFLRVVNASLNAQMAMQRLDAARLVAAFFPESEVTGQLIDLAAEEADDGVRVLRSPGTASARGALGVCSSLAHRAANMNKPAKHTRMIDRARTACMAANQRLGTGLTMKLGTGNLAMKSSRFQPRHDADEGDELAVENP